MTGVTPRFNILLAFPFRPFFLLTGVFGLVTITAWLSHLLGGLTLPVGWSSVYWHSHEMLFGLVAAAIAGFLLTALCNWTGAPPLKGMALLGLIALWLAGRLAMWTASWWPPAVVALLDLAFLPVMAVYVLHVLVRHGNKRNLPLAGILMALASANAMMHFGFITRQMLWLNFGLLMACNLITLMMVIIGGRIIPAFTANWLRSNGRRGEDVMTSTLVERAALVTTALLLPLDFLTHAPWLVGILAGIAAIIHGVRLWGWSGWQARGEPLLGVLHLGYGWIVIALVLKSAAAFGVVGATAWLHALGVGGMGTLILGVMTRVALGHTGRALRLPAWGIAIYIAITFAAITRLVTALQLVDYRWGLLLAAFAWSLAFAVFIWLYWPILSRARQDGRPG